VNTLLVDPPAAPDSERPPAADGQVGGSAGPPGEQPGSAERTCRNCGTPLRDGQEWCLQCGAGQPGSIGGRRGWGPLSTLTLVAVLLVGAAVAAGAAALGAHETAPPRTLTVAQAPTPPVTSTPTTSTPVVPGTSSTPTPKAPAVKAPKGETGANNPLFPSTGKPPKIPSTTSTPKSSGTEPKSGTESKPTETTPATTTPSESESEGGAGTKAEQPSAILLDTDAASTYNPYNYPEAGFGDAALAIDGEVSTAWTAQVQPSSAPQMAEGLLIDLKASMKLGSVKLITVTPGMTVQLYGTDGHKAPSTITEPGWTPLSSSRVLKKKTTTVKLHTGSRTFRYVVVWIVKAPASAVGTPQAPGHVDLNEVELFPPAS
jgi:hypothetical protein